MFDIIVITASNDAQAAGYRAVVERLCGVSAAEIAVVPDPGGRRVGSLGSTVNVLKSLGRRARGKRVLICHSGGDSKRLPAYAAIGKAFVPVPQPDGSCKTLFEVIVGNMERLRLPEAGVLVVCGDVAPRFDFAACDFSRPGVTGVGYRDTSDEGSRHGVYVPGSGAGVLRPVEGFLQKPDETCAREAGALVRGRVVVDTGILWLDAESAARLGRSDWHVGDLYETFTAALVGGWAPFRVNVVPRCTFFHIGSSRELLDLLGGGREWVEGCEIPRSRMKLAGRNIVTGVPASYGPVTLGRGECLVSLPIGERDWVHVRYRVEDTFKTDGKWEAKVHRLGRKRLSFGELMPLVNPRRRIGASGGEPVVIEKPLRIDFAGGWSDTPPICNRMGGCVFNAAVTLNGVKPVKVSVRRTARPGVAVESVDLGKKAVYLTDAEIAAHTDPHDWGCLVKSALTVTGYRVADGGLDIRISADVPKGSGLGTSSILGAALVEALGKVFRRGFDWRTVSELTLRLEREMRTGGGWQDQIGGLVPGAKLITSRPGARQVLTVKPLGPAAEEAFRRFLSSRALLYFTGQKRMARNVLRGVLAFFEANRAGVARAIVGRLKADAIDAFQAVGRGDWAAFCSAVNGYWLAKKALDPGSTNPGVESIIARIAPWTSAVSLCGAGGGGFMFIVARDASSRKRIQDVLERLLPEHAGAFYRFSVC